MSPLDWLLFALYLAVVLALGLRAARSSATSEAFLLADRSMPWWAMGLSVMATQASAITFIVIFALLFAHWLTGSGVPTAIVEFAVSNEFEPWQFLLFLSIIMILLGTVLDAIAVLLIVTPIVLPTLGSLGIDPVHFGIVLIVNMEIAFLTPPIGLNLFVLSNIAKAPMTETIRGVAPFVALLFCFLLLIMFFPELSLWLPRAVYG